MFSVLFEVHPRTGRFDDYLALAARLKPLLERIDGFLENERFESLARPGWLLSHSAWRDEKSVVRWRTQGEHHGVQQRGRSEIFQDYRLRVGEILADSGLPAGMQLREQRLDETETGAAKLATLTELMAPQDGGRTAPAPADLGLDTAHPDLVGHEIFQSITRPGKFALLAGWKSAQAGLAWRPRAGAGRELRHRAIRVVREYGMYDRRESPQFHAPARAPGDAA